MLGLWCISDAHQHETQILKHISCEMEMANAEDPYAVGCNRCRFFQYVHNPACPRIDVHILPLLHLSSG